jgi:hypothetical protein
MEFAIWVAVLDCVNLVGLLHPQSLVDYVHLVIPPAAGSELEGRPAHHHQVQLQWAPLDGSEHIQYVLVIFQRVT